MAYYSVFTRNSFLRVKNSHFCMGLKLLYLKGNQLCKESMKYRELLFKKRKEFCLRTLLFI